MTTKTNLYKCLIEGQIDFFKFSSLNSPLPEAFYLESEKRIVYASGLDFAPCNGIMEKNSSSLTPEEITKAIEFFSKKDIPFIWWTDSEILKNYSFQFGGILKGIAVDLEEIAFKEHALNSNIEIKIVKTIQELENFSYVMNTGFGMEGKVATQMHDLLKANLNFPEQSQNLIAYYNEQPASVLTICFGKTSAGIWNFATLPEMRKNGIGTAIMQEALMLSLNKGYKQCMAILMPKGLAKNVFAHFGFSELMDFPFYVYGASSDDIEK